MKGIKPPSSSTLQLQPDEVVTPHPEHTHTRLWNHFNRRLKSKWVTLLPAEYFADPRESKDLEAAQRLQRIRECRACWPHLGNSWQRSICSLCWIYSHPRAANGPQTSCALPVSQLTSQCIGLPGLENVLLGGEEATWVNGEEQKDFLHLWDSQ